MARRRFLTLVALGLPVSLAVAHGIHRTDTSDAAAAAARPNIIVVETDDQTAGSMRVMPNVRSLIGRAGATFENSFVNFSLCCPSRSTFLTGQYAHNHGVLANVPPDGGFSRFQELHGDNNLAVWLQDAGYHTAMVGKYLNGYANKPAVPPGWSEWYAAASGLQAETNSQKVYDYTLNENGTPVRYGEDPADFKQDVLTRRAVGFVNRRAPQPQPFFLWLTYTAPHAGGPDPNPQPPFDCGEAPKPAPRHAHALDSEPLPKPPSFNEADVSDKPAHIRSLPRLTPGRITDRQRIYRCELESLLSVDDGVKKVVDALRSRGELAETLLVFTSDNGFEHGEHRIFQGKQRAYEESIRVPLLMRGPGIPAGTTVRDLVINADLAPTIVNVAGASAGLTMDGRSLMPIVRQPGTAAGRELLIETSSYKDRPSFAAIRTQRYLYAEHDSGESELYDLQHDPFELVSRDRDPAYASARAQLASRLLRLRTCAGASCRTRP